MASAVGAVGRGQHRDPVRAADPLGDRVGGADHVTATQRDVAEPDGVLEIAAACDNGGVQRGQQHVSRLAHRPFADHPVAAQRSEIVAGQSETAEDLIVVLAERGRS